jgi:hypothetical protein
LERAADGSSDLEGGFAERDGGEGHLGWRYKAYCL